RSLSRRLLYLLTRHLMLSFSFFSMPPLPPTSTLFPYTTLFRSCICTIAIRLAPGSGTCKSLEIAYNFICEWAICCAKYANKGILDRKSTRLNSSHVKISYAVFCLKKKKKKQETEKVENYTYRMT